MTAETQAPDPAPAKPFFAYDPDNGVEWFETMQEAQAYATESLREYRRSASFDGEWSGDVEAVKVGHVTHFVAEHGAKETGYDYRLVSATPAPEGALRAAANAVLTRWNSPLWRQEVGTAELMAKLRTALAAPAPQAPAIPDGWTALRMERTPGHPETVAYGPAADIEQLRATLDAYYTGLRAEQYRASLPVVEAGAIAAPQAAPAWQPIDTAPKDGTAILAFWKPVSGAPESHCYGITEFVDGRWCNPEDDDDYYIAPTHWMPLPAAPQTKEQP